MNTKNKNIYHYYLNKILSTQRTEEDNTNHKPFSQQELTTLVSNLDVRQVDFVSSRAEKTGEASQFNLTANDINKHDTYISDTERSQILVDAKALQTISSHEANSVNNYSVEKERNRNLSPEALKVLENLQRLKNKARNNKETEDFLKNETALLEDSVKKKKMF